MAHNNTIMTMIHTLLILAVPQSKFTLSFVTILAFSYLKVGMSFNVVHSERCRVVGKLQLVKIWTNLNLKSKSRLAGYMYQSSSSLKICSTTTLDSSYKTEKYWQICHDVPKEKCKSQQHVQAIWIDENQKQKSIK